MIKSENKRATLYKLYDIIIVSSWHGVAAIKVSLCVYSFWFLKSHTRTRLYPLPFWTKGSVCNSNEYIAQITWMTVEKVKHAYFRCNKYFYSDPRYEPSAVVKRVFLCHKHRKIVNTHLTILEMYVNGKLESLCIKQISPTMVKHEKKKKR